MSKESNYQLLGRKFALENKAWRVKFCAKPYIVGPVNTHWRMVGGRASRLDPLVRHLNRGCLNTRADVFYEFDELKRARFDVLIVVKTLLGFNQSHIRHVKNQGGHVIYLIGDNNPNGDLFYLDNPDLMKQMDGIVAASPLQQQDIEALSVKCTTIHSPAINRVCKKSYDTNGALKIIWQGWWHNRSNLLEQIEPVIHKLVKNTGKDIEMILHTNSPKFSKGRLKFVPFEHHNWEHVLCHADIAITAKDKNDRVSARKPATKVIQYMAAGIPVIAIPSSADSDVIECGRTGFLIENSSQWYEALEPLVLQTSLRQRIGQAARSEITKNHSLRTTGRRYLDFFSSVLS